MSADFDQLARNPTSWGVWSLPKDDLRLLGDVAGFDVVFSDHGAMSFASPDLTIPEVARILRAGGAFAFNVEHPLHAAAWDDAAGEPSRGLQHPYFALDRIDDLEDGSVNFARPISGYVELLLAHGFVIERLLEPRSPVGATTTYGDFAGQTGGRDFPAELMVRARRTARGSA